MQSGFSHLLISMCHGEGLCFLSALVLYFYFIQSFFFHPHDNLSQPVTFGNKILSHKINNRNAHEIVIHTASYKSCNIFYAQKINDL